MFKGFGEFRRRILEKRAREKTEQQAQLAFMVAFQARQTEIMGPLMDFENGLTYRVNPGQACRYLLNEIAFLRARVDKLEGPK